ncbi:mRNA decapping complex subunit 2 [Galdieria sulphuraria]|uniref:mRNA-decapping enzyme subunit 2 n=1 Tax=Galdieria sulphuraria TaxID=130081 RepID=M2XG68_GALSU|nr:mRNA-decapping enzyme subunit 2 [Galdieria sulphuraria]EME29037.1 mRNA-decapping enzyme subunit 2 [Galdieria sulphuraria]GJD06977.1 mRNA decapping complex subunit 2 [Galdieria sulphuraria]|eukprot:XP_005705557.1 mRNA-decapping enzyme subunit 2 [Galdieria sulphuraria]
MQNELSSVLIDLSSRFLLTLSQEDFENFERLFFAVEEAHWFYDDFFREKNSSLPKLSLREFAALLFEHSPLLDKYTKNVKHLLKNFQQYKNSIPTAGVALLNSTLEKVLLVKGFRGKSWSFPKGKVGKDESYESCAVREAREEVGFDVSNQLYRENLLTSNWQGHESYIFIVPGIPDSTRFETNTRKEISEIKWHDIFSLPSSEDDSGGNELHPKLKRSRFFSVLPFVKPLQSWVLSRNRNLGMTRDSSGLEYPRTKASFSNVTSKRLSRREALSKQRVETKSLKTNKKDLETFGVGKPFSSWEEERNFLQACFDRSSQGTTMQPTEQAFLIDVNSRKGSGLSNFAFSRQSIEAEWERLILGNVSQN